MTANAAPPRATSSDGQHHVSGDRPGKMRRRRHCPSLKEAGNAGNISACARWIVSAWTFGAGM